MTNNINTIEVVTELNRNVAKLKNELVFSRYSLNPLAQDILQLMIAQIRHDHTNNLEFDIKIKLIEDRIGRRLREEEIIIACENILNQKIYLNTKDLFSGFNWCEYVCFHKTTRSLKIKFTEKVSVLLFDLVNKGGFTKMNLKYFLKIKSFYAKRIYMYVKGKLDFETEELHKKESIKVISIEDLKDMLDIDQDSYKEISDLKKRVIDISINQINKFSDIDLKIEFLSDKKSGKKFTKVRFISNIKESFLEEYKKEVKADKEEIKYIKKNKIGFNKKYNNAETRKLTEDMKCTGNVAIDEWLKAQEN
ncbi:replication initiation protein [Aliarcobacter butzleri]|uniref:replication initiation protein n=1 Tax=Aliarcobacter butzleri TaxID=28197 RepID=UPI0021B23BFD|nr:replication initiation protein [Aliarcobacter butzleri]MCT7596082.1 replication initiation protein [Aliarcobacter butzleri]